ncbi:phosphatase PAP2 family protein [Pantoea ananatis]
MYELLSSFLHDSHDYVMRRTKTHYRRVRPFLIYHDAAYAPEKDNKMTGAGPYASGLAFFAWTGAFVQAEINPACQTGILRRGYDFCKSRVFCGAHWQSDVDAGRLMGHSWLQYDTIILVLLKKLRSAKNEYAQSSNPEQKL